MIPLTPMEVARSFCWIREAQEHVNSCAVEFDDQECLAAAIELQQSIDSEWDSLGLLVAGRARPYSALRAHLAQFSHERVSLGPPQLPVREDDHADSAT